jgi:uncharacterized protein YjbI with pentapeptide repeats
MRYRTVRVTDDDGQVRLLGPGADLREMKLTGRKLTRVNLSGADLSGCILSGTMFMKSNLSGANFSKVTWHTGAVRDSECEGANFTESMVGALGVTNCEMRGVCFARADAENLRIIDCRVYDADFRDANLCRAALTYSMFGGSHWERAVITQAIVEQISVVGCDFDDVALGGSLWRAAEGETLPKGWISAEVFGNTTHLGVDVEALSEYATLIGADPEFAVALGADHQTASPRELRAVLRATLSARSSS